MQTPPQYRGFYIFVSHEKMTIVYLAIFSLPSASLPDREGFFFFSFCFIVSYRYHWYFLSIFKIKICFEFK